jgi:group I intron endonuclease
MFLVYVALCVPRDKLYFGITSATLSTRVRKHVWESNCKPKFRFHLALRKHGPANFVWFEIGRVATWEDACDIERALIGYFNTRDPLKGYNDTDGGDGRYGNKASEETRRKMREAWKHRGPMSDDQRQKLKEAWKRRPPTSEETRRRMSVARKGKPMNFTPEALERIGAANRGKKRPKAHAKEI